MVPHLMHYQTPHCFCKLACMHCHSCACVSRMQNRMALATIVRFVVGTDPSLARPVLYSPWRCCFYTWHAAEQQCFAFAFCLEDPDPCLGHGLGLQYRRGISTSTELWSADRSCQCVVHAGILWGVCLEADSLVE